MKICPTCKKTYSDDGLNFCLEDGSVLSFASADLPETLMMQSPMPTSPGPGRELPPTTPGGFGTQPGTQSSYGNNPQFSMQPPVKKSKTWVWLLGIVGLGLLLCGGGGALLFGLAIYNAPNDPNNPDPPVNGSKTPSRTPVKSPTPGTFPAGDVEKIDLAPFAAKNEFGAATFAGGELTMNSARARYYYVVCAADSYKSESATTRVTVRNTQDASTSLGYGVVFHSNPTPLQQGYAFLIDTKKKKYRVVRHEPGKEIDVVAWTSSDAINEGSENNILEVRHKDDMNELYINGQMVTSIRNTFGYQGGVVGLYAADGIKIGFKNFEIERGSKKGT
jgi:hypothetical protein